MPDSRVNGSLPNAVVKVAGYTEHFEWMFFIYLLPCRENGKAEAMVVEWKAGDEGTVLFFSF